MTITIFLIIFGFIVVMESAIPFLLRRTIAFGVTIPEGYTDNMVVASYRKMYSAIISSIGLISLFGFAFWANSNTVTEEQIVLIGLAIQFGILFLTMALYLYFHAKTTQLKRAHNWGADLKQIRIVDLAIRTKDEMLPSSIYALPMAITIGLIAYTASQYGNMPDMIPTHWGPNGQPDAFSPKTPFSVIALLLIQLIMQGMLLGFNALIKRSGIKLNAAKSKSSQVQQLSFRKYSSWFLFMTTVLSTILMSFLHLSTIHEGIGNTALMLIMPLGFLLLILIGTAVYAFKVGQSGSRIAVAFEDEATPGITDVDDDQYWKFGAIYVNKNDPSIFVEKRFGIGWTINFGQPLGYIILFVPLVLILVISFLL
ncbi:DUF1648 domain-containing protein [Sporosarcina sp. YIM B06819]|uniref:DUF1648 domain-containing protein n=1 Tax=Sporosarcina sp. YIM B06819 TaxID=3081769 RepID=UPI00298BE7FA|nr:DUF5808 domain-containing protein [Sporosarcina sp. YIM B06819]